MAGLGATTLKKKPVIPTPTIPAPKPPALQPAVKPMQPVQPVAAAPAPAIAPAVATTPTQAAQVAPQTTGLGATAVPATTPITDPNDPRYTGNQDDVVQITNDILKGDSLLMQQAGADGYAAANSRGLMNSSMGVGAAQEAIVNVAVPLASQDASQNFQKNMAGLGTQQTSLLNAEQAAADLKAQRAGQRADTRAQQRDINFETGQAALDREQQAELQTQQIESQQYMQAQELALQEKLSNSGASEAQQELATNALNNVFNDYNNQIAAIQSNPNLTAAERTSQIEAAKQMLDMRIDYTNDLYTTSFDWPDNPWGDTTSEPAPIKAPIKVAKK